MSKTILNSGYQKKNPKHKALLQNLAKEITKECFRNSYLESLHKGISPYSKTNDYTDVHIITPEGSIPWNELSRINNEEMQRLIVEVVDRVYTVLNNLTYSSFSDMFKETLNRQEMTPEWINPKVINKTILKNEDHYWNDRVVSAKKHQKEFYRKTHDNLK